MPKRVNLLGIPIDVVDEKEIAEAAEEGGIHPYIVMRCTDTNDRAIPPALLARRLRTICELCGELCYQDPKNFDSLKGLLMVIICMRCMVGRRDDVVALCERHAE